MRVNKSKGSSGFSQVIYFKPGEIDQMCEAELRKAGCLPDSPQSVDVELFIEKHFGCTIDFTDIAEGVLGFTFFDKNGKPQIVGVSPSLDDGTATGRRRTRSTFAHEAGHCMMHPMLFMENSTPALLGHNLDFEERRILCRENDLQNTKAQYDGRWWEYQANCAIGGFLLPKRLSIAATEDFLSPAGLLGIKILHEDNREDAARNLSDVFDVSLAVARIRLSQIYPAETQEILL